MDGWNGLGSLCGVIILALLCGANNGRYRTGRATKNQPARRQHHCQSAEYWKKNLDHFPESIHCPERNTWLRHADRNADLLSPQGSFLTPWYARKVYFE